jgi:hypothetical protein
MNWGATGRSCLLPRGLARRFGVCVTNAGPRCDHDVRQKAQGKCARSRQRFGRVVSKAGRRSSITAQRGLWLVHT